MKIDKIIDNITGAFNAAVGSEGEDNEQISNNIREKQKQEQEDRQRYQELKRRYELHSDYENGDVFGIRFLPNNRDSGGEASSSSGKHCNPVGCVLECPLWPEDGFMTEDGNIYYEDPDMDEEFYGTANAIESRKRVAAMTPKGYTKYKQELEKLHYSR